LGRVGSASRPCSKRLGMFKTFSAQNPSRLSQSGDLSYRSRSPRVAWRRRR
jgi:hypothetical protein